MTEKGDVVLLVDAPSDRRTVVARAHAQSHHVKKVYVTSGGGLLYHDGLNFPKDKIEILPIHYTDTKNILKLAKEKQPNLVEVGQDDAIHLGLTDVLRRNGFVTFGVSRAAGKHEWDKTFARRELLKHGASNCLPPHRAFKKPKTGLEYIESRFSKGYQGRLFIKAVYPCLGKGVYGVRTIEEALEVFSKLQELPNNAGRAFLVEDGIGGPQAEEYSGYFFGNEFVEFGYYQDHKTAFDNDLGPNTGGKGSVGPLPWATPEFRSRNRQQMVNPLTKSLSERGLDYRGILYLAGMYDPENDQIWNIEFNVRNGGSEAASNIPGIKNDYYEMTRTVAEGKDTTHPLSIEHDGKIRVAVAGASLGYPDDYSNVIGKKVSGLEQVIKRGEVSVLGAGIEDDFTVIGGRIFWLVAAEDTVEQAIKVVYRNMEELSIPGDNLGEDLLHFRRDIGARALRHQLVA